MRVFYDTEFLEDGQTIALISIGMVSDDGREYYAVASDAPMHLIRMHPWLMQNVVPSLPIAPECKPALEDYLADPNENWKAAFAVELDVTDPAVKPRAEIAGGVRDFLQAIDDVELWAWYAAYDHVVLAQLFGRMIDLPPGIPMWTNDLRQECHRLGNPPMPPQQTGEHNALADARHNRVMARFMDALA